MFESFVLIATCYKHHFCHDNTKVGTSSAAMSQCCSMKQCRLGSVAACSSADLAALQHATVQTWQRCNSATMQPRLGISRWDGLGL